MMQRLSAEESRKKAVKLIDEAIKEGRSSLLEYESEELAQEYGIPVAKGKLAKTEKQALLAAKRLGFPLVMKIVSPDILHKSDIGGVKTDIHSKAQIVTAFKKILQNARKSANLKADIKGVYVQRMAPKSTEFVVGGLRDAQFGPTVMFGLGGIYVELFRDVSFRLAPLSEEEGISMMKEIKSAPLLTGFRGSQPLNLLSAAKVIVSVGQIMTSFSQVESIDINPLFIYPKGAVAVDVRIILRRDT